MDSHGIAMHLITPIGSGEVRIGLLGGFNLSNLLAVVATVVSYFLSAERKPRVVSAEESLSFPRLAAALGELKPVPGRMQIVSAEGEVSDISVVVDYAHTPDGLRSALLGLREHFSGELTCLFGAGGNRDVGKRPLMGEVAERYADTVILTDDNPRTEDGDAIIDQIRSGFVQPEIVTKIRNRAEAIATVIAAAKPGAVILIAGKGHEDYQEINGQRQPFSDLEHARAALVKRRSSSSFRDSIQRDAT
jgi:UDP-N-acetylmuramoyl-L-alanyl-D-glutamate--2,6-diaminopimelate ligase